ncbi:MAG: hypothetical protein WC807_08395 [Hyphomicrobium sp.]|jgi:hypothetical protein
MLSWFQNLFQRRQVTVGRQTPPLTRVAFDDGEIRVAESHGVSQQIRWANLGSVLVKATNAGPERLELCWVLTQRDGRQGVVVPMGATGEIDLLHAMQARLEGFDNMAVIEAMSSLEAGDFQVWPPAADLGG